MAISHFLRKSKCHVSFSTSFRKSRWHVSSSALLRKSRCHVSFPALFRKARIQKFKSPHRWRKSWTSPFPFCLRWRHMAWTSFSSLCHVSFSTSFRKSRWHMSPSPPFRKVEDTCLLPTFLRKVGDTCHSWPSSEKANHSKFKQGLGGENPELCFFQMAYEGATCPLPIPPATWHCRSHPEEAPHVHPSFLQGQPPFEIQIPLRGGAIWKDFSRQLTLVCHMSRPPCIRKSRKSPLWGGAFCFFPSCSPATWQCGATLRWRHMSASPFL